MTDTPAAAWQRLVEGNERFASGGAQHPRQDEARRAELVAGQAPFATVFTCGDSRVVPSALFDSGLGDIFEVRNAGHVATDSAIASIEYGVGVCRTPVLVVLAHQSCGAVRAAIDSRAADAAPLPPYIAHLIEPIANAVRTATGSKPGESIDPQQVDAAEVGRQHVAQTIAALLERSEMIADAVASGATAIVGATYTLDNGRVVRESAIGLD